MPRRIYMNGVRLNPEYLTPGEQVGADQFPAGRTYRTEWGRMRVMGEVVAIRASVKCWPIPPLFDILWGVGTDQAIGRD